MNLFGQEKLRQIIHALCCRSSMGATTKICPEYQDKII